MICADTAEHLSCSDSHRSPRVLLSSWTDCCKPSLLVLMQLTSGYLQLQSPAAQADMLHEGSSSVHRTLSQMSAAHWFDAESCMSVCRERCS